MSSNLLRAQGLCISNGMRNISDEMWLFHPNLRIGAQGWWPLLEWPAVTVTSSGTVWGLPTALLGRLSIADKGPTSCANTTTSIRQLLPGASEDPHKLVALKSPLLVPSPRVIDGFAIETERVPVFMMVNVL